MKFKRLAATLMVMTFLGSVTVFAKTETVETVPVYSYEEILEKALKANDDLALLESSLDLLSKQSQSASFQLGGLTEAVVPDGFAQSNSYMALRQLGGLNLQSQSERYEKIKVTEKLEYTLMTVMSELKANEAALELSEKESYVEEQKYYMATSQYNLGMISLSAFEEAEKAYNDYKTNLEDLKYKVDSAYKELAVLMGTPSAEFEIDYSVDFETFEINGSVNYYAKNNLKSNPLILSVEESVEYLDKNKFFTVANSSSPYAYDETMHELEEAEVALKGAKEDFETMVEDLYNGLKTLEANITQLEKDLELVNRNLEATKESYATGAATNLQLVTAEVNAKKLENTLVQLKEQYMSMVYSIENPNVMAS